VPKYEVDEDDKCKINLKAVCEDGEEIFPIPDTDDEGTYFKIVQNAIDVSTQPALNDDVVFEEVGNEDDDETKEVEASGSFVVSAFTPIDLVWTFAVLGDNPQQGKIDDSEIMQHTSRRLSFICSS